MTTSVRIVDAAPEHQRELVAMVEEYWRYESIEGFDAGRITALLMRVMQEPHLGRAWIATVNGEPAGYLLAVYVFSLEHQGLTAEIDEFYVLTRHRKSGLGGAMLSTAEAAFRKEGCTNVSLQLGRGNEAARKFYQRHGFGDRDGYDLVSKVLT
jgi:GNAT superfamily N-acetyltransferase